MASPTVFIGSTFDDLEGIRNEVAGFLESIEYHPRRFEDGGIDFRNNKTLEQACYDAVSKSDYYILILANQYGSPTYDQKNKKKYDSVNKKEFQRAISEKIPIFVFISRELRSAFELFSNNKFSLTLQYPGIKDNQILSFLREVYDTVGERTFIDTYETSDDIILSLKKQFASIVRRSGVKNKNRNKKTKQTRINAIRLWYEVTHKSNLTYENLSNKVGIGPRRLRELSKMSWHENKPVSEDDFPMCSYKELGKIEKALECIGELSVGKMTDFQHFYLAAYCKRFKKYLFQKYPNSYHANGFRVKAVVFDFDGTLTYAPETTWELIWSRLGYPPEDCGKYHGQFRRNLITHEEWCQITLEKFRVKGLTRERLKTISTEVKLRNGIRDLIAEIYNDGIRLHVLSGSIKSVILQTLGKDESMFRNIQANIIDFDSSDLISEIVGTQYDFANKAKFIQEQIIGRENLHPLEILYVGNSANDAWVANSGVRTLCVDPKHTDPDEPLEWSDKITPFTDGTQIIEHVYRGSNVLEYTFLQM